MRMKQWRVGTLSMGLLLIALGVVMLVAQINGVSVVSQILKWWPVILIILGAEILVYVFLSQQEEPKVKFDVFSIFIIIFIMMFSVGTYAVTSILTGDFKDSFFAQLHLYKYESTFQKDYTIPAQGSEKLIIDHAFGKVDVEKGVSDKVEVEANILIRNNDQEYAKSIVDSLVEITEGNEIKIKSKSKQYLDSKSKVEDIKINYLVRVPETINIEVENEFGNVDVKGINGTVDIKSKHGKVAVEDIKKDATIKNSFGQVGVREVNGNVYIENNNDSIDVNQVGGNLTVASKFGKIEAKKVQGNVDIVGSHGDISLVDIGGDVKAVNQFDDIELIQANKKVELECTHGEVFFQTDRKVEGDVNIENKYGRIILKVPKEQQGSFKAWTEFGRIDDGLGLEVKEDVNTQTVNQKIGDSKVVFDLRTKNGDIVLKSY